MRALVFALLAVVLCAATASASAAKGCHNITGTCFENGFQCANDEMVPHSKRCNGVEDCADGTDEFMCTHDDSSPLAERSPAERHAVQQATCVKCTCAVATQAIATTSGWWQYAARAPTDFIGLMTGTGAYRGKPCNAKCAGTILMGFYKKYKVCRGWLCCARQRECQSCNTVPTGCSGAVIADRCWP